MRTLVIGLAFIAGVTAAMAQDSGQGCAVVADDAERLACYDRIFRDTTASVPTGTVALASERLIPAQPTGREPATLEFACVGGSMKVTFAFAGQPMSSTGDIAPLTYQVDQGVTTVRTLGASADNRSLSFNARDTTVFLDALVGGTNLKVRVTPVRQRSLTVDFRLPEAQAGIAALRESCR